jgi:hypothetical protein
MQQTNERILQVEKDLGETVKTSLVINLNNSTAMTFDNSKTIIAGRIRLFAATVIILGYMVMAYIAEVIRFPVFGLSDTLITLILVAVYLAVVIYPMILNYQFISYSDEEDKIVLRYFNSGFIRGKNNYVAIAKKDFAGYRREKKFFGLYQKLILFHQLPQGIAKYPPVFISNLTSAERGKLLNSLYQHTPSDAVEVKE